MIALIAILLLLIVPGAMTIIYLLRQKSNYLWLLAMVSALLAWAMVYISGENIPEEFSPVSWQPETLFPLSPALLIDSSSWIFALALATQIVAIMFTSVVRLAGRLFPERGDTAPTKGISNPLQNQLDASQGKNWQAWAANLATSGLGLVAVFSGNLVTLLLAWAALDMLELLILLVQFSSVDLRRRIVTSFTIRISGAALLIFAGILIWNQDGLLSFTSIDPKAVPFILIAAGLRLGILPLNLPFLQALPMRIGQGTVLRLVPVASSLVLVVRCAQTGLPGVVGLIFLGLTAIAGLAGGIGWLRAKDGLSGRPYWILATTSLAMIASIQAQTNASLAWSLAALLPGNLIFLSSARRRSMVPILLAGALLITGLPYTPTWAGTSIFQLMGFSAGIIGRIIALLIGLILVAIHTLLLNGYFLHGLQGILTNKDNQSSQVDRSTWSLYISGLIIILAIYFLLGWWIRPTPVQQPLIMWIEGAVVLGLAAALWFYTSRSTGLISNPLTGKNWLSNEQIYRPLYRPTMWLFRLLEQVIRMVSGILEGEAGILWALVLLVLVMIFIKQ